MDLRWNVVGEYIVTILLLSCLYYVFVPTYLYMKQKCAYKWLSLKMWWKTRQERVAREKCGFVIGGGAKSK